MRIAGTSQDECRELLRRLSVGRLACALDNRLYVVHVRFAYEPEHLYVFSTMEQKIEWMRKNPIVCLQTDEIRDRSNWTSVVLNGTYLELSEPLDATGKQHARELLAKYAEWWQTLLGERRERTTDLSIEPIFFSC